MKRVLAILLTALMLCALLPVTAFAEEKNYVGEGRVTQVDPVGWDQGYTVTWDTTVADQPLCILTVDDNKKLGFDGFVYRAFVSVSRPNVPGITHGYAAKRVQGTAYNEKIDALIEHKEKDILDGKAKGEFAITWMNSNNVVIYTEYVKYTIIAGENFEPQAVTIPSVTEDRVEIHLSDALEGTITTRFEESGDLVLTIGEATAENWAQAYVDEGFGEPVIRASIRINRPEEEYDRVNKIQGNMYFDEFISCMKGEDGYLELSTDENTGGGFEIAQLVPQADGGYEVVPVERTHGIYLGWRKEIDDEPFMEILSIRVEVAAGVGTTKIQNPFNKISKSRIHTEVDLLSNVTGSFDENKQLIQYLYPKALQETLIDCEKSEWENVTTRIDAPTSESELKACTVNGNSQQLMNENGIVYIEYARPYIDHGGPAIGNDAISIIWEYKDDSKIVEGLTLSVDFKDKIYWPDQLWDRLPLSERITIDSIPPTTSSGYTNLNGSGLDVYIEDGKIVSSFREGVKPNIQAIYDTEIIINAPEGATAFRGGGCNGDNEGYDPGRARDQLSFMDNGKIDIGKHIIRQVHLCKSFTVDGITIWYAQDIGSVNFNLINWYTDDKNGNKVPLTDSKGEPIREYFTFEMLPFFERTTTQVAQSEEEIEDIEEPTMAVAEKNNVNSLSVMNTQEDLGKLIYTTYPQEGNESAHYFELNYEGAEEAIEGKDRVIYLPYSCLKEGLTYEQAKGKTFTVKHYEEDKQTIRDTLTGEATEKGLRFVVGSFSPFVVEWVDTPVPPTPGIAGIPLETGLAQKAAEKQTAGTASTASGASVACGALNLRATPGRSGAKLGLLTRGTKLTILSIENGWVKVQLADGTQGYVAEQYLSSVGSGAQTVNARNLNIRTGMGMNTKKLGTAKRGTKLTVLDIQNGWAKILWNDAIAYVSAQYLQ